LESPLSLGVSLSLEPLHPPQVPAERVDVVKLTVTATAMSAMNIFFINGKYIKMSISQARELFFRARLAIYSDSQHLMPL